MKSMPEIRQAIVAYCEENGLTQAALARQMQVSEATVHKWIAGKTNIHPLNWKKLSHLIAPHLDSCTAVTQTNPAESPCDFTTVDFWGHEVRMFPGDEPVFVATDVAKAMGYADPDKAIRDHCGKSKPYPAKTAGQVRHLNVIPFGDVYLLLLTSRLRDNREIVNRVCHEILPSIQKTGAYVAPGAQLPASGDVSALIAKFEEIKEIKEDLLNTTKHLRLAKNQADNANTRLDNERHSHGDRNALVDEFDALACLFNEWHMQFFKARNGVEHWLRNTFVVGDGEPMTLAQITNEYNSADATRIRERTMEEALKRTFGAVGVVLPTVLGGERHYRKLQRKLRHVEEHVYDNLED